MDRQTTGGWLGLVILDPKPELIRSKEPLDKPLRPILQEKWSSL